MSKSFNEVKDAVAFHNGTVSSVPGQFAQMYIDGVQADYQVRYAEWETVRDEAVAGGFTPPDAPVQPPVETVDEVLERANAELEHAAYQKPRAKSGETTVLAGYTYTPDLAQNLEFIHIRLVVNVRDVANSLMNSYDVELINRPSGVEVVSVIDLGEPEHSFSDGSTIGATIGGGFVRLELPTTGSGEELLINHDVTYSR